MKQKLFPGNQGISLEIALFTTDKWDWVKGMDESDDQVTYAINLAKTLLTSFQDSPTSKKDFDEFEKQIGIKARGNVDSIEDFETEITIKETGTTIERKRGTFTDKNAHTHKFTLWGDQFSGISKWTEIEISNGYLSFDTSIDDSINVVSKSDIKIISG